MAESLVRILNHGGELWLNLEELKKLADGREDLLGQSLAMLRVAYDKRETPHNAMRGAIGVFLMAATGEDDGVVIPVEIKPDKTLQEAQAYYDALVKIRDGDPDIAPHAYPAYAMGIIGARGRPS